MMLKKAGHTITTAENGEEAVNLIYAEDTANETRYDVILMDLQMPVMDGLEATKRIRLLETGGENRKLSPKISRIVIGMSANSDSETVRLAYGAGVNSFIPKPFKIDALFATIQPLLLPTEKDIDHIIL